MNIGWFSKVLTSFYCLVLSLLLISGCSEYELPPVDYSPDSASVTYGSELVHGLAACGFCHGAAVDRDAPLAGGVILQDRYGPITAPNLTRHQGWNPTDIVSAVRGISLPEDRRFSSRYHKGYEWLSDDDVYSIAYYIKTLAPTGTVHETRDVGFWKRNTVGFMEEAARTVPGFVPKPQKRNKIEYGRYIVDSVARCSSCHDTLATFLTPAVYLGGGQEIVIGEDIGVAPSLIGSESISTWSEQEVIGYLTTGKTPQGNKANPALCPIEYFAQAKDEELLAIAAYLRQ